MAREAMPLAGVDVPVVRLLPQSQPASAGRR